MAVSNPVSIGTVENHTTTRTTSLTTSGTVPAGALVVLICMWKQPAGADNVSVTTAGGLTWNKDRDWTVASTDNFQTTIFTAPAPSGLASSTSLGVTLDGSNTHWGMGMSACYIEGVDAPPGSGGDYFNGERGSNSDQFWWNQTPPTVAISGESAILCGQFGDGSNGTATWSSGTELQDWGDTGNNWQYTVGYRVETSAGSYSMDGSWTVSFAFGQMDWYLALPATAANQRILPDADTSAGSWGTAPLYSKINDSSDATVITDTLA